MEIIFQDGRGAAHVLKSNPLPQRKKAFKPAQPNSNSSSGEDALSYLNCEGRDSLPTVVSGNIAAASPICGAAVYASMGSQSLLEPLAFGSLYVFLGPVVSSWYLFSSHLLYKTSSPQF